VKSECLHEGYRCKQTPDTSRSRKTLESECLTPAHPPPPGNRQNRGRNQMRRGQRSLFSAVKLSRFWTRLPSNMYALDLHSYA